MPRRRTNKDLENILQKIPADKQYIGRKLIDELIFMQDTLTTLKRKIKENGTEEEFIQGKQNFIRESTALKSYNTTVQRYGSLYKQLTDLMPKSVEAENSSAVYDFIKECSE